MATLLPEGKQSFTDSAGQPLVGGKVYTYDAGTNSPRPTYQDAAGTVPNTNPVVLDARGEATIFWSGAYKVVLKDASDNTIWSVDDVFDEGSSLRSDLGSTAGAALVGFDWAALPAAINKIDWGIHIARNGVNVLRYLPPAEWPAVLNGTSATDLTAYIQSAINAISNSWEKTLYFPAGKFNFTRLYCVYDAVNNPGFNIARNGEVIVTGNGVNTENGGNAGTTLNSTVAVGDAFIASNYADDASPWRSRDFEMHNLSLNASTTGYAMVIAGVPSARLNNVKITQFNAAGSGLYLSTTYFGTFEKLRVGNSAGGTKTGAAITFTSTNYAGLLTFRDLNVGGFAYGFEKIGGGWQNITFSDSELTGSVYAIHIKGGGLQQLTIQNCYFEGAPTSFLKVTADEGLDSLTILGGWMLSTLLTGTAIDLKKIGAVSIDGLYVLNQYTTFMRIDSLPVGYSGGAHSVNALTFAYTVNPSSQVYYFAGYIPSIYSVSYPSTVAFCKLTNGLNLQINSRSNYAGTSYMAAGHMLETSMLNLGAIAGSTIDLSTGGVYHAFVYAYNVTAPATLLLPPQSLNLPHGYSITITNSVDSTQTPVVKRATADGGTTLANLAPGTQRKFVYFNDGVSTGWR